jgi:SAM-dependent methyltransferase
MRLAPQYPGLRCQPDHGGNFAVLLQPLRCFLRSQFGRPAGVWGRLAGMIMARRPSNLERIRWTLQLLDPKPDERILEIGFGPGIAIEILSHAIPQGFIVGVDHSEVMVEQARRRNAQAAREGRVTLYVGSVSNLPNFTDSFDKIFTINSIHFWNKPVDCLKKLHELTRAGGMIAVTIQPRSRGANDTTTRIVGEEIVTNLESAGFSRCRLQICHTRPVATACAVGFKESRTNV